MLMCQTRDITQYREPADSRICLTMSFTDKENRAAVSEH